ncbi:MAG: hypothetical protein GC157_10500 [Frankiales bacterium]|nr:hypothetical protein [Frankiales bacterium]
MLPATRRRVLPASLLLTGALGAGILGTSVPAQAATIAPASVTTAVSTTTAATTTTTSAKAAAAAALRARITANRARMRAAAAHRAAVRGKAVHIARTRLGMRYVAGAAGPTRFDCSGLAMYVVKHTTGRSLPHYSRAQYGVMRHVSRRNLHPGDLVFFFRHGAHHVGIYIGHGRMISATNPRTGVKIDRVFSGWYGSRYSGAGRLV